MNDGYDGGAYIDCTECGHPVESHSPDGCRAGYGGPCGCSARWTIKAIKALRRRHGLPGEWRGKEYGW